MLTKILNVPSLPILSPHGSVNGRDEIRTMCVFVTLTAYIYQIKQRKEILFKSVSNPFAGLLVAFSLDT